MWIKILALSCCAGICYRIGGAGGFKNNKLVRRLGIPILQFIAIFFVLKISAPFWVHFLSIGITFGFLSSYWDFINGDDSHWLHGLGIGLGCVLYAYVGAISWLALATRTIVLALVMGIGSRLTVNDVLEEGFIRGPVIIWSLPLLIILA